MRIVRSNDETRQNILANLLKRDPNNYSGYEKTVQAIVEDVKSRRDEAILEYTKKFDGVELKPEELRVTAEEIE